MSHPSDIINHVVKGVAWALGSISSMCAAFMEHSLPVLQWVACCTAIAAGYFSIRASRAAIQKAKSK